MVTIYGDVLDEAGRCTHYHSAVDVIANKCATCDKYWACYECHAVMTDHRFGAMDLESPAVMCGACGHEMVFSEYAGSTNSCPQCGQLFNPGCSLHRHIYFKLD
ncbi:CHY zinc finger protein [Corynebacterium sp.]|uniref:CHY zinc finger protein n=1 Tax=Corynebacterium sp. TaxID=1720 RepID=UPI0028A9AB9F|nr:CHY zinc finger protein [Corynebacterium sp.]